MERDVNEILVEIEQRLKAAEQMISKFDEQAEKRIEARTREKELEARILEAKLKWRPKDWFILSGIIATLCGFLAILAVVLILAFSYVPPTTTTSVSDVNHRTHTVSSDYSTNNTNASFSIK